MASGVRRIEVHKDASSICASEPMRQDARSHGRIEMHPDTSSVYIVGATQQDTQSIRVVALSDEHGDGASVLGAPSHRYNGALDDAAIHYSKCLPADLAKDASITSAKDGYHRYCDFSFIEPRSPMEPGGRFEKIRFLTTDFHASIPKSPIAARWPGEHSELTLSGFLRSSSPVYKMTALKLVFRTDTWKFDVHFCVTPPSSNEAKRMVLLGLIMCLPVRPDRFCGTCNGALIDFWNEVRQELDRVTMVDRLPAASSADRDG